MAIGVSAVLTSDESSVAESYTKEERAKEEVNL